MKLVRYVLGFQSYNSQCLTSVNGVMALKNYGDEGPISAGVTVSAY